MQHFQTAYNWWECPFFFDNDPEGLMSPFFALLGGALQNARTHHPAVYSSRLECRSLADLLSESSRFLLKIPLTLSFGFRWPQLLPAPQDWNSWKVFFVFNRNAYLCWIQQQILLKAILIEDLDEGFLDFPFWIGLLSQTGWLRGWPPRRSPDGFKERLCWSV